MGAFANVKWILRLCTFLGTTPKFHQSQIRPRKIYTTCTISLLLAGYAQWIFAIYLHSKQVHTSMSIFLSLIATSLMYCNILVAYKCSWSKADEFYGVFLILQKLDEGLGLITPSSNDLPVVAGFISFYLIVTGVDFADALERGLPWYTYRIGGVVLYFYTYSNCILVASMLHCTLVRLQGLTCAVKMRLAKTTEDFAKLHVYICDIVDKVNELYGSFIFLSMLASFLLLLSIFEACMGILQYTFELIIIVLSCVIVVVVLMALATKAEHISQENVAFVRCCYKASLMHDVDDKTRVKFAALAQQAALQTPIVNAAGLFPLNYATLFMLCNTLATYVVIVVQFLQNP